LASLARAAPWVWALFVSGLLLLPLLLRSRQALREFTLLAGISAAAAALDLLFVTLLSLSTFESPTLVVFTALAVYAWARQWLFDRLLARHALTTERIFDQLYRTAREVQARPDRYAQHLAALLRDLFEPLEALRGPGELARSRVAGSGASLLVPLLAPPEAGGDDGRPSTLVLRFARRGQRLFVREDALLAGHVVEQLRRAVAYDLAVERGRAEERARIAQDLHDDIGARLLTLMYQAPNAEMEDYLRHTLKDLKTLTRGLAAGHMRWSHALAEWKADLAQRTAAARIELDWIARHDEDPVLGVVQWSALTRVLRELVSNTLHHGRASHVRVQIQLERRRLQLSVTDDGVGGDPQSWSHGLGLGGVRKRVKALGGEVAWRQGTPRGIVCEVRVVELAAQSWGS
jgi:signal transduction histidine kinase